MPFTIFCHQNTPEDALEFLKKHNAIIENEQNSWNATFIFQDNELSGSKPSYPRKVDTL